MTADPVELELLELPAPYHALPYAAQKRAFDTAQTRLPHAQIVATLGAALAEQALINATAHILETTGNGSPPMYDSTDQQQARGAARMAGGSWSGSAYGDTVAGILARLGSPSGRVRKMPFAV